MTNINLVLFHKGPVLPSYIFDCLYQVCLLHQKSNLQIYILTDKCHHTTIFQKIQTFYLPFGNKIINNINCVDLSTIKYTEEHLQFNKLFDIYEKKFPDIFNFRNGFWRLSIERFFYLTDFIKNNSLKNVFHTENDIMMYSDLNQVHINIKTIFEEKDTFYILKDSPTRGIGSFMFSLSEMPWIDFCRFVNVQLQSKFSNDMNLLGAYPNCITLPDSPNHSVSRTLGIFDAACIGQYLGGTDPRKGASVDFDDGDHESSFINPTKGFVNETSVFKPNTCRYMHVIDKGFKKWMLIHNDGAKLPIHNLHIHSKNLYEFSSILDINYLQLPSPKNFMKNCDFVFCEKENVDKSEKKTLFGNVVLIENKMITSSFLSKLISEKNKGSDFTQLRIFLDLDYHTYCNFNKSLTTLDLPGYDIYIYNYNLSAPEILSVHYPKRVSKIYNPNIDSTVIDNRFFSLPLYITNENQFAIYKNMINTYFTAPSKQKVLTQYEYWKCLFEGNIPVMNGTKFQSSLFKFDKYEININFYL
jgi:hypothetical protein